MDTPTTPLTRQMDGFIQMIKNVWHRYNQDFSVLFPISIVAASPIILAGALGFTDESRLASIAENELWTPTMISIIGGIVLIAFVTALAASLAGVALQARIAAPEKATSVGGAFRYGLSRLIDLFTTNILEGLAIVVWMIPGFALFIWAIWHQFKIGSNAIQFGPLLIGFLALVIGVLVSVFFSLRFMFGTYVVFREERKNIDALRRSFDLTKGFFWSVAWRLAGVNILVSIATAILNGSVVLISSYFPGTVETIFTETVAALITVVSVPLQILFLSELFRNLTWVKGETGNSVTPPPASPVATV